MMKKLRLFFIFAAVLLTLTGCESGGVSDTSPTPATTTSAETSVPITTATTAGVSGDTSPTSEASVDDTPAPTYEVTLPIPYDKTAYLSDDEFVVLNGVTLGMTYDEALSLLSDYEVSVFDGPTVKIIATGNYRLYFYAMNETFGHYIDGEYVERLLGLNRDGTCYLLTVDIDSACTDPLIRDIKIGDSVEAVSEKFPFKSTKLQKWAYQNLYGKDEISEPHASLEYTTVLGTYRILLTTPNRLLEISFDKENNVRSLELSLYDT